MQQGLNEAKEKKHMNLLIIWTIELVYWSLNKCGSEQMDIQEEAPVVSKFLNNSSNASGMQKFINEKNCETLNEPVKCSMDSQQNFFNHLLNEIQFPREEVKIKNIIIKILLLSK